MLEGGPTHPLLPHKQGSMSDHRQHHLSSGESYNQLNTHHAAHHHHHHQQQQHHLSSVGKVFGNIIISLVGSGVLGLPYTFKKTGWLSSCIAIIAVGGASYYCMMLLVWSRKKLEKDGDHHVETFSDLGYLIYGKLGRFAVDFLLVLSQGAFCTAYLIFIGKNLASVFTGEDAAITFFSKPNSTELVADKGMLDGSNIHSMHATKGSLVDTVAEGTILGGFFSSKEGYIWVVFPLEVALASIPSLTMLAPFSIFADFANGLSMLVVMQQDVATIIKKSVLTVVASQSVTALPFAIGVAIYAYEGVGLVLPLESSMKERKKFGRVLGLAMVCVTFFYIMFGLLGYLAFGDETLDIVTLNLGTSWKTTVVKVGLCVGLFFTFSVMMYPVHRVMEQRLGRGGRSMILRTLIVLAATLCAVAVPHFSDFLSLVGNSVCCMLAFVAPALIHMKAHKEDISRSLLGLDWAIIVFGISYGVIGTVYAVLDTAV